MRTDDGTVFGSGASAVYFQYQGVAAIGERQLPRNDRTCVAAHVAPFSCGTYRSTSGTGSLAFLAADPFALTFQHANGELTAEFRGRCNTMSASLQRTAHTLVAIPVGSTAMGCSGDRQQHDAALTAFFDGELTSALDGRRVTFTSADGRTSATFTRR